MKNKLLSLMLCLAFILPLTASFSADSRRYTVAEVESLRGGIVAYKAGSAQAFIDSELCSNAGISAEFYAIALSQSGGYDFSRYENALKNYINGHTVRSASTRLKYALTLAAVGSSDRYITDTANEAIGGQGLMSLVFGLHLLNNGYDSALYSTDSLIDEILSRQLSDGGWAVIGSYGDIDVTAMTLQALAPHYYSRYDVQSAIDRAVNLLSSKQLDSGGFKTMGDENCESAAQVVTALSALGIDSNSDPRFIKASGSALGAMISYKNPDGSFSHIIGKGFNESATIEAFYAFTAYLRMQYGQSPLYMLDHAVHTAPKSDGNSSSDGSGSNSGSDSGSNQNPNSGTGSDSDNNSSSPGSENAAKPVKPSETALPSQPIETKAAETAVAPIVPSTAPAHGDFQPSATALSQSTPDSAGAGKVGPGYKLYAILGIIGAAGVACLILFLLKKRGKKHYISVLIIAAAGVLFILLTNFQSAEEFHEKPAEDGDLTVTMTIRCDTILDRDKVNSHIPNDGVILPKTQFKIIDGETAYDVLLTASKSYSVQIDNRGPRGAAYIAGINYLYEFDYGELSGWMYRINGEFPDVGCQGYTLSDGDVIEWLYTTNIGKDLQ